jgi:hypothetical protein
MGFIKDNTNSFDIYLTDLGRQKTLDGGLMTAVKYFSISDTDANYEFFIPNPNEILPYDGTNLANYEPGDYVVTGDTYYKFKIGTGSRSAPPSDWWEAKVVFNPNVITKQPIPVINHAGTKLTSLGNDNAFDDDYLNDVFVQIKLRGTKVDNREYTKALYTIKNNTERSYVLYEPNVAQTTNSILTYIVI